MNQQEKNKIIKGFCEQCTGNVCDAMVQLGLPLGVVQGLKPLSFFQPTGVGFAFTIKQMQRHQGAKESNVTIHDKLTDQEFSYGDIVVIDAGGRLDVCTGGSLLAQRAQQLGVQGYLINGCFRDLKEIVSLGLPVYFLGGCPVKSSPNLETVAFNVPVEINNVQVKPGDIIMMDDSGVIVIPLDYAEVILELSQEIKHKEAMVKKLMEEGKTFLEAKKSGLY